jgi:hypothetical protein
MQFLPRCLVPETPWWYARTIKDYCTCVRLFFEYSLCRSPFGYQRALCADTIPLLPDLIECTKVGIISFSSQGGLVRPNQLRQREYVDIIVWNRPGVCIAEFANAIRQAGFSVAVDDEVPNYYSLTEEMEDGEWRSYTHTAFEGMSPDLKQKYIDNYWFKLSPTSLQRQARERVSMISACDTVWGRSELIKTIAKLATQMFPPLPPSTMYDRWKTSKPVYCYYKRKS